MAVDDSLWSRRRPALTEEQTADLKQRVHAMRAEARAREETLDVADIMQCFEEWVSDQPYPDEVRFLSL